ncbi:hypothetical protein [Sphingomonas sp. TZW2008]|uniref:hypothetical protein n=1 Tax=Sphingomonas sp. TZW2008 TaxID=1917973 RepID=UPI0011818306|nr:hypothetical protein [Sphingomonas sp. TZW2008]
MGIDRYNLEFLIEAHKRTGPFRKLATLGRQGLHFSEGDIPFADKMIRTSGIGISLEEASGKDLYADNRLFSRFGASETISLDASTFEQAAIIHDFNDPIPDQFDERFDTVIDGGSLEHIFNVPVAVSNLMRMTRVGGHVMGMTPANNWLGHGFYQFSPEWVFRIFAPSNGFVAEAVFLSHMDGTPLEEIFDAGAAGKRGEIGITRWLTTMYYIARKVEHVRPFEARWPQQGDYQAAWDANE